MIDTAQNLKEYKQRLHRALDNKFLRTTLGGFAGASAFPLANHYRAVMAWGS